MNFLVCVKQVPDTTEIKIDPVKNTLIRDGVPSIVNPYDGYALETAARIKDENPDTKIVVLSMGPEQAKNALRECLAIGADKAYLVSDRAFGGSDTLATSYILSQAIAKIEETEGKFDVIFCGKQAIDGDTAQVGPSIAEHLDMAQITYGVEAKVEDGMVKVKREADVGYTLTGAKMPCVVTMTQTFYEPRYPTIKSKMAAKKAQITTLTSEDFTVDLERAGLKGSPTKVKKTYVPQRRKDGMIVDEGSVEASTQKLVELLNGAMVI
ncbi:MAG: electron transfer flavoprotein subunit beta/FixA family protein [Eubacteriales bacterium]|nr:electron transfer flavoprotein subunit beta/FixA family protein [Eubacteriales bacterium]